jgi:hypothetical protein
MKSVVRDTYIVGANKGGRQYNNTSIILEGEVRAHRNIPENLSDQLP